MSELTPFIQKLEAKLKRQTESVIETQALINTLKDAVNAKATAANKAR